MTFGSVLGWIGILVHTLPKKFTLSSENINRRKDSNGNVIYSQIENI